LCPGDPGTRFRFFRRHICPVRKSLTRTGMPLKIATLSISPAGGNRFSGREPFSPTRTSTGPSREGRPSPGSWPGR
jgi:hypothetical protein